MPSTDLLTTSTSLQKAVAWIGKTLRQHPDKQRGKVIAEAALRVAPLKSCDEEATVTVHQTRVFAEATMIFVDIFLTAQ